MYVRRFILLNPFDAYAGSQRVGRDVAAAMSKMGYDVEIRLGFGGSGFLSDVPGQVPDIRCSDVTIRKILYPLWALWAAFPVLLAALRGKIIWANTIYAVLPAIFAIMILPSRVVIHLHETSFAVPFRWMLRIAVARGSSILCVSADQAARIGLPATILPNAVEPPQLDVPSARDRLLFVGTSQPIKGFDLFVEVSRHLPDLSLRKTAYLSDQARHNADLVRAAREAEIEIHFGVSAPEEMYRDGFLLLMASDPAKCSETFSLVAVEAMSRLVPVAGAGSTVLSEVLSDALAFDAPTRDPQAIAAAIVQLHSDPKRYATLCIACAERRWIYSGTAFSERLLKIIQSMEPSQS